MNKKRIEWKVRIDEMLSEHRVEMAQIQGRILEEQQKPYESVVWDCFAVEWSSKWDFG